MRPDQYDDTSDRGDDPEVSGAIPAAIADALADDAAIAAPSSLFDRVQRAATNARPAGAIALGADAAEPAEAFLQTATELRDLLRTLRPADWDAPTTTQYGTVHDVVAHLAGSEDYCTRALARVEALDPVVDFDHAACSREVAESLRDLTTAELIDTWFGLATNFAESYRNEADTETVSLHQLPVTPSGGLVLRTFEVWAHTEDICSALGRPLPRLDGPRLAVMSARLVAAIGFTIATKARPQAIGRLVLIGPGGGVASLGAAAADGAPPDVRIVADIVDYCRVASRRVAIDEFRCRVEGDQSLVPGFLAATAMFAKD